MSNVYILNKLNYFNRQIYTGTLTGDESVYTEVGANFNYNDGVDTVFVAGRQTNSYMDNGNYLLVYDFFISSWFIVDSKKLRNGQYELYLHRDVIRDYYNLIYDKPMFIEKATLPDYDPLIFNKENMTYNQIKSGEWLLKDKTKVPWVVGYYDKKNPLSGNLASVSLEGVADITLDYPIAGWEYFKYTTEPFESLKNNSFELRAKFISSVPTLFFKDFLLGVSNEGKNVYFKSKEFDVDPGLREPFEFEYTYENSLYKSPIKKVFSNFTNWVYLYRSVLNNFSYESQGSLKSLLAFQGKFIQDSTGKVFKIQINRDSDKKETKSVIFGSDLFVRMDSCFKQVQIDPPLPEKKHFLFGNSQANEFSYEVFSRLECYSITLEVQTQYQGSYNFAQARQTQDAPYNIFCLPFGDVTIGNINMTQSQSFSIINEMISTEYSSGRLYDAQLLPYCPLQSIDYDTTTGVINLPTEADLYTEIKNADGVVVGYFFNAPFSSFSFTLQQLNGEVAVETALPPMDEVKVESECSFYRLCSPNYNGQFEFNRAKNGGIDYFDIDCTYKPFSPYIHVSPNFGGLYGRDYDDVRGLICGGEFSLPLMTDNWEKYQAQNKNYQNIFNRQIENMEITQKYQRLQEGVGMVGNAIGSGAATGATVGSVAGPIGGIVAGVAGTVTSLAGGLADLKINDRLRSEALDYTKDMFGFQLGNIQALPNSLTRVDAFTRNNKIFPVLEYYTCTDEEKDALREKIKYNGMTVGRIGKLGDYRTDELSYIKGRIIRLPYDMDSHIANAIADELYKGVFI